MPRKKALIIGINYTGSKHQLNGCINDALNCREYLVRERGFGATPHDMVLMTDHPDNRGTPFEPTGANMTAAFHWLISGNQPGDSLWLSYSGHGGQVKDPDGDRDSGYDDTICPLDFESKGQLDSDTSPHLTDESPFELPFMYRPDSQGRINLVDQAKQGMSLATQAYNLLHGGFSAAKINDARALITAGKSWFASLNVGPPQAHNESGLGEEHFIEDWKNEGKDVWMFSGCADSQTSADTSIAGAATGAMSHAFIKTLRADPNQSYVQVLQNTRLELAQKYQQIPQLSVGGEYDLSQKVYI
ncbi:hypothetical protein G7Y89_g2292 [Cudoniella acicularis]|uniref:Peptidase C14 caspase domain-containing protein n=1 Tax=Cudoniella acicularis TaxID=354080 RepID=A0A8H4W743_9HELO|nr:hypothetical protein G7Y89_g2292 [Cudoniella acicularis]